MMVHPRPTCTLWCSSREISVQRFSLTNWGISREYEIEVVLQKYDPALKLAHGVCLEIEDGYFHGFVSHIEQVKSGQFCEQKLQIQSPLAFYLNSFHTRIYNETSIKTLLQRLLEEAGLLKEDFTFDFRQAETSVWFYQENMRTIDFLRHILNSQGIFYHYQQNKTACTCVFSDHLWDLLPQENAEIMVQQQTGLHHGFTHQLISQNHQLCTQKYEHQFYQPYENLWQKKGFQSQHAHATGKKTQACLNNDCSAKVAQHICDEKSQQILLSSCQLNVLPGQEVIFKNAMTEKSGYRVCSIAIEGTLEHGQSFKEDTVAAENGKLRVTSYLSDAFCGFADDGQSRKFSNTLQLAQIEHPESLYPDLSSNGKYWLRLLSDEAPGEEQTLVANKNTKASCKLRNALYFSGNHYGMSLPLQKKSTVVVGFENGISQQPIILGSIPEQSHISIVNRSNPTQNLIRSYSGNDLCFTESDGVKTYILSTPKRQNFLQLSQSQDEIFFKLSSVEGSIKLEALKKISFKTKDDCVFNAKASLQAWVGEDFKCFSHHEHLNIDSEASIKIRQTKGVIMKATEQTWKAKEAMSCKLQQVLKIEAKKHLVFQNQRAQQAWQAGQGKIILKGFETLKLKQAMSLIMINSETIALSTPGMVQLNAPSVSGLLQD